MKAWRKFDIDIYGLSNKKHQFEFSIDDDFFAEVEDSLVDKGKAEVKLTLDKSDTLIVTQFDINGVVQLICDRTGEEFDYSVSTQNKIIFKYGDGFNELTDEIVTIPWDTQKLSVGQYIYEFIGLTIPYKKIHPNCLIEEDDDPTQETMLIYSTSPEGPEEEKETKEGGEENFGEVDPRWEILKNFKQNNN